MKKQNYLTNKQVGALMVKRGWQVFDLKNDSANGPDMTIARGGKTYRGEVKNAMRGQRCWKVKPVGKSGQQCEIIIIVLPDHNLIIQPMAEHLSLCSKNGDRFITMLVEINAQEAKLREMIVAGLETGDTK